MQRKSVLQLAPLDKLQLQCTCMYNSGQKETWDSSNFLGIQSKVPSPLAVLSKVLFGYVWAIFWVIKKMVLHFQFTLEDLFVYNITPVVLLKSKLPPSRETRFL